MSLPTDPPRHVVDAGYYDNYGMQVSTAWLHANREWLARHTSGVLLIQIRDSLSVMDRVDTDDHTTTPWEMISHGFDLVLNPIQAAARARSSTSMFRNDLEVEYLNDWFTMATGHRDFFTTVVFENPAAVASLPIRHDRTKLPGDDIIEALGGSVSIVSATDTDPNKGQRMTEQVMSKLKLSHRINENISMNWFLAPSDMEAMKSTFPRTDDEGAKNTPEDRVKRLAQCAVLEQLVRILKDEPREYGASRTRAASELRPVAHGQERLVVGGSRPERGRRIPLRVPLASRDDRPDRPRPGQDRDRVPVVVTVRRSGV